MTAEQEMFISHLYKNKDGQWVFQSNTDHQKGVAEMAASFAGQEIAR